MIGAALLMTAAVYLPGLSGSWLFDDFPNIVDNQGVQPSEVSVSSVVRAALSSPSSEFRRPLASLSFVANYLGTGLRPYAWKATNLVIHLLNGWLVFLLSRQLLQATSRRTVNLPVATNPVGAASTAMLPAEYPSEGIAAEAAPTSGRAGVVATLIAACWMLLPINLTAVLYVVQRMESMANLFVLAGLIGYVEGRRRMLGMTVSAGEAAPPSARRPGGFVLCLLSITVPTAVGILAKETAVMLPLYAALIEWIVFGFRPPAMAKAPLSAARRDHRLIALFVLVLVLPMVAGLGWLLPGLLGHEAWAARDFTLATRLLSEARVIVDYIVWTVLPTPGALSFYHDDFHVSTGLLSPWTTLASIALLAGLIALMLRLRRRRPLVALGIALFLGCQLLTGTILPLELIYEHRNYFASFGLMLAIVPLLAALPRKRAPAARSPETVAVGEFAPSVRSFKTNGTAHGHGMREVSQALPLATVRYVALAGLMLYGTSLTAVTAYAWGDPLRLAQSLAARAPQSPRAQYELGRNYIIKSHYDPNSPYTRMAYAPLERAAKLPDSSILPQQALIFMNSRMHLPLKDAWWDSMIAKLKAHKPGVQDESSLVALTQCANERNCELPQGRMVEAFTAALSHPEPSARLLATYGDYAWNTLGNHALGEGMTEEAVKSSPDEPAYRITLIRMLAAQGEVQRALEALHQLELLNIGGRLNTSLEELRALPGLR
ncbi:tetratricopeptide repeat protein [Dyella ginsengisoli]